MATLFDKRLGLPVAGNALGNCVSCLGLFGESGEDVTRSLGTVVGNHYSTNAIDLDSKAWEYATKVAVLGKGRNVVCVKEAEHRGKLSIGSRFGYRDKAHSTPNA